MSIYIESKYMNLHSIISVNIFFFTRFEKLIFFFIRFEKLIFFFTKFEKFIFFGIIAINFLV